MLMCSMPTHIGLRLRELRLAQGLSAAEVARRAAMTPQALWRYESGRVSPGADALVRIVTALGVTADAALGIERPAS